MLICFLFCGLDVLPYFNSNFIYLVLIGQSIYLQERRHLHYQVQMDDFDVVVSSSPQTWFTLFYTKFSFFKCQKKTHTELGTSVNVK